MLREEMTTEGDYLQFVARSISNQHARSLKRALKITAIGYEFEFDDSIEFSLFPSEDLSIAEIKGNVLTSHEGEVLTIGKLETELSKNAITITCVPKPIIEM